MITAWQDAGVWDKAIVIVQGDHSTRVPVMTPLTTTQGRSTWRDFLDSYPALYAIKAPGYTPGVDTQQLAITHLFGSFMQQFSGGQPEKIDTPAPFVFLTEPSAFSYLDQVSEPLSAFIGAPTVTASSQPAQ
jgi:hypothetical protein